MGVLTDIRTAAHAKLAGVSGLLATYAARPGDLGGVPAAFVGDMRINLAHDAGLRMWSGEVDVVLVLNAFDNVEAAESADTLIESVIDAFSDDPHAAGANTVSEPTKVRSTAWEQADGVTLPAWVVTIGRFVFTEGR